MIKLVYGGSGSGKSKFAEELAVSTKAERKYYVATMQIYDDEGRKKVSRHRKLRAGKGFVTIEQPVCIGAAAERIKSDVAARHNQQEARTAEMLQAAPTAKTAVLLECVTNLVANEMFPSESDAGQSESFYGLEESVVVSRIKSGLEKLFSFADDIIIVSGNVFDDGAEYDESTLAYMRALGAVNAFIASKSDEVYEVVAGIHVKITHKEKCAQSCGSGKMSRKAVAHKAVKM